MPHCQPCTALHLVVEVQVVESTCASNVMVQPYPEPGFLQVSEPPTPPIITTKNEKSHGRSHCYVLATHRRRSARWAQLCPCIGGLAAAAFLSASQAEEEAKERTRMLH